MRRPSGGSGGLGAGFGKLLGANLSSSLADGIARTAAPLLAVRLSEDPLQIAGVAAVLQLPWLLLALPSGLLIDRFDRRRILAAASLGRAVLAAALLVLTATGNLTIWWLYAVLFLYGAGETLADGSIRAIVPSIVAPAGLPRANSRIEVGEQVLQGFVAAPVTSVLFAVSALIPLGLDSAAFAVAAALAFVLPSAAAGRDDASTEAEPLGVRWRAGLAFLLGNRMLLLLWLFSTFFGFTLTMASSLVPLFALDHLGLPEGLFGGLLLAEAVGSVLVVGFIERLRRRFGSGRTMGVAAVLGSLAFVLAGAIPNLGVLALSLVLYAAALSVWNVLCISLRQAAIPPSLLGRVHGTWRTLHWGAAPLGALLGGVLGRVDISLPFLVGGGAAALGALALLPRFLRLPEPEELAG